MLIWGREGSHSVLSGLKSNVKHVVVRIHRLDQNLHSGREATYGSEGDQLSPNMEAPTMSSLPPSVVTGLLSAAIYCPPMSTPQLSSSYSLIFMIFTFYNLEFLIYNLLFVTPNNSCPTADR